jgi:hypothetical protein
MKRGADRIKAKWIKWSKKFAAAVSVFVIAGATLTEGKAGRRVTWIWLTDGPLFTFRIQMAAIMMRTGRPQQFHLI